MKSNETLFSTLFKKRFTEIEQFFKPVNYAFGKSAFRNDLLAPSRQSFTPSQILSILECF